jgi:sensor domain CHASE-containing protein
MNQRELELAVSRGIAADRSRRKANSKGVWWMLIGFAAIVLLAILLFAVWSWRAGIAEKRQQHEGVQRIEAMIDSISP